MYTINDHRKCYNKLIEKFPRSEQINNSEEGLESIPSVEEVRSLFEKLLEGQEFEEIRRCEDEQGLYLWDIKIPGEDGDTELSYMRKGRYKEGQASITAIHITFLDQEGNFVNGHSVAKYTDNSWELTP